ncbi:MAG TPA: hypothetical protein VMV92_44550, partial [Streptosporangiaceae bacterium]|nr:hypothetical protein [Streptosporangiaceae bacterium]
ARVHRGITSRCRNVIIFRPDRYRQPAAGTRTARPGPAPGLASGKEIHATCQTTAALRKRG